MVATSRTYFSKGIRLQYIILLAFLVSGCKSPLTGTLFNPTSDPRDLSKASFSLADGSGFTKDNQVSIQFDADNAEEYSVHFDLVDCQNTSNWQTVLTGEQVALPNHNNNNSIYIKFQNSEQQTSCLKKEIIHDDFAPAAPAALTLIEPFPDRSEDETPEVHFTAPGTDSGPSGFLRYEARSTCDSDSIWVPIQSGEQLSDYSPSSGLSECYIYLRGIDLAGNISFTLKSTPYYVFGKVNRLQSLGDTPMTSFKYIDYNTDGSIDLVGPNGGTLAWYQNDGSGNFAYQVIAENAGTSIHSHSDIDDDGDLDFIMTDVTGVNFLLRNDGGSYSPYYFKELQAAHLIVDLNADGLLDALSVENRAAFDEVMYANINKGNLEFEKNLVTDGFYRRITFGDGSTFFPQDINGDGQMELVEYKFKFNMFSPNEYSAFLYENILSGSASKKLLYQSNTNFISIFDSPGNFADWHDLDKDGDIDFIFSIEGQKVLSWLRNDGNSFTEISIDTTMSSYSKGSRILDVNGDSELDILFCNGNYEILKYINDGDENFARSTLVTTTDVCHKFNVVDLDNDTELDLQLDLGWYINDGGFSGFTRTPHQWRLNTEVHNLDADTYPDYAAYSNGSFSWYKNNNDSTFTENVLKAWPFYSEHVEVGDIDGDGDDDILYLKPDGNMGWRQNSGGGDFSTDSTITVTAKTEKYNMALVDLDDDTDMDIVISAGIGSNGIFWYENDGSENFTERTLHSGAIYQSAFVLDFDKDGDKDVVTHIWSTVFWLRNDGNENFTPVTIDNSFTNIEKITVGDVEPDADYDVIALESSFSDKGVFMLNNNGGMSFTKSKIIDTEISVFSSYVQLIDLDGDTVPELVAAVGGPGWPKTYIYQNTGSYVFSETFNYYTDFENYQFMDFDNDGDLDMYASDSWGSLFACTHDGVLGFSCLKETSNGFSNFRLIDMNDDGDLDFISELLEWVDKL